MATTFTFPDGETINITSLDDCFGALRRLNADHDARLLELDQRSEIQRLNREHADNLVLLSRKFDYFRAKRQQAGEAA
ncbi:MAG: hypothetical protein KDI51_20580 [Xanthomonadales bacterium]|nr:hypothetical protein [Xanthomonadales bacterium]